MSYAIRQLNVDSPKGAALARIGMHGPRTPTSMSPPPAKSGILYYLGKLICREAERNVLFL